MAAIAQIVVFFMPQIYRKFRQVALVLLINSTQFANINQYKGV